MVEQKAVHFCLTVWGPPESERGGGFCVKPLKGGRAHGEVKAARQGRRRRRRRPCSRTLISLCSWRVLGEGARGCPCLQPSPQWPVRACRALGVLLCWEPHCLWLFLSRSTRDNCPTAFCLYPVVLPLQVWIYSDGLLEGGFAAGWRRGGIGCCVLSWGQNLTCKTWNSTVSER